MTHPNESPTDPDATLADDTQQQRAVRGLLGNLPDPGPMPDDLVVRIQARLADEALRQGTSVAPVIDLASRRRARLMGAVAAVGAVAASAAVVGVLATGGLSSLQQADSNDRLAPHARTSTSSRSATPSASVQIRESGTAVTDATLDSRAAALSRQTFTPRVPERAVGGALGTPAGLSSCLSTLGVTAPTALSAELTTYEQRPAVVVAVRTSGGDLQAWVLDRSCHELAPHRTIS